MNSDTLCKLSDRLEKAIGAYAPSTNTNYQESQATISLKNLEMSIVIAKTMSEFFKASAQEQSVVEGDNLQ